jgi:hypothetical protein
LEKLWRPNPKDLAGGQVLQTRFTVNPTAQSVATAAVVFTGAVVCPTNTVRVITLLNWSMTPGAAQIANYIGLQLISSGSAIFGITQEPPYVKGAAIFWGGNLNLGDGFMMRPTDSLNVTGQFSAGAAANTFGFQLYGYDLPIGNVQ